MNNLVAPKANIPANKLETAQTIMHKLKSNIE